MTKTRVIRVFSFIMALTLVFAICSPTSYAISPRQFGAWIASALTALNITYQSTVAPYYNFMDYLSDPFQINDGVLDYVPLQYPKESVDDYLKQSTISFTGDYIEIDGKHYQDVWLSNEAAEKFRVNAFDLKSAFNIASESNGTYVSGAGYLESVPVYDVNGIIQSQKYSTGFGTYNIGNFTFVNTSGTAGHFKLLKNGQIVYDNSMSYGIESINYQQIVRSSNTQAFTRNVYTSVLYPVERTYSSSLFPATYVSQPFDFDWVSGIIPADEQLAPTDGLHLYVPSDPTEWTDSPETQTIINNYNTYIQNNPDIEPDVDLDLNTPGLLDKIGDLLDILGPIIDLMKPTFGPQGQEPTPPVPPVPGDTIAETPWDSLVEWLQRIVNKLDYILGIRDIVSNFKTAFDTAIFSILNWLSQIKSILQSILDAISDLVDTIVHGNVDWFSDIVDAIKQPFLPWLNIFKSGVSIWHYVVEWLQSIHEPFVFFFGVLNSLGYHFVLPFYAVAAACIVIAIYRRFGR